MQYNPFSLEGKKIFVTGASSGIGKAIAIHCSRMGGEMIISGRNEDRIENTLQLLEGNRHSKIIVNLNDTHDIDSLVNELPPLDGIVHCAGVTDIVPFMFVNRKKLDHIFNINFYAPALVTQLILKKGKLNAASSIVFISSISGVYCSSYGGSMYSASKGAINGLIKGMALDLSAKKIRVNSINPGVIETEIFDEGQISKDQLAEDIKKYPLKRHGKPEEVAYAAIYLLSDASIWMTGNNMILDGGYTLS